MHLQSKTSSAEAATGGDCHAQTSSQSVGLPASAKGEPGGVQPGDKPASGKKRKLGRNEWRRHHRDLRKQGNADSQAKRRKTQHGEDKEGEGAEGAQDGDTAAIEPSGAPDPRKANPFTSEEIAAESRRPKRKVAVMVGYSGTGYKGMQINWDEKTIEGDLFKAFIAAGAISKANADDPKKSSLARCARTDKGVHAAGNVISLKLIIEDEDIVEKVNQNLPPQIRVWGIQRTNNSFSCYQSCDSRWYEYLMPTYCLLPAHPETYFGKKLVEAAEKEGGSALDEFRARLADTDGFWKAVDAKSIKPILDNLEPAVKAEVVQRLHQEEEPNGEQLPASSSNGADNNNNKASTMTMSTEEPSVVDRNEEGAAAVSEFTEKPKKDASPVDLAIRDIKAAYVAAKRAYRVTPERLRQLQEALNLYVGTKNFHNYTVQKSFRDPSAKRHIRSFEANPNPIQIGNTQWISLKVHGQSFMMHQIRKMVSMAVLAVRSGTPLSRITESYRENRISIPKAPGLGLLLECPVFEGYSRKAVENLGKDPIDFSKYEAQMQAFKDKEIYQRIFEVEETENTFHHFFEQLDNFKSEYFLWLTASGIKVVGADGENTPGKETISMEARLDDEDEDDPEGGDG